MRSRNQRKDGSERASVPRSTLVNPEGLSALLSPIERVVVNEQILSRLKAYIKDEHLKIGSKFPSERQLASMLNVSRHSVREALSALGVLGVLKRRQGKGTYLASTVPKPLNRPEQILEFHESLDIVELWEARVALEPYVASLAAVRRSEEDLHLIGKQLESMRNNLKEPGNFLQFDMQFHLSVTRACGNNTLGKIMSLLLERFFHRGAQLGILNYARGIPGKGGGLLDFIADHEGILKALRRRNSTLARSRMIHHLRAVGKYDIHLLRARAARPGSENKGRGPVAKRRPGSVEDVILTHG